MVDQGRCGGERILLLGAWIWSQGGIQAHAQIGTFTKPLGAYYAMAASLMEDSSGDGTVQVQA